MHGFKFIFNLTFRRILIVNRMRHLKFTLFLSLSYLVVFLGVRYDITNRTGRTTTGIDQKNETK